RVPPLRPFPQRNSTFTSAAAADAPPVNECCDVSTTTEQPTAGPAPIEESRPAVCGALCHYFPMPTAETETDATASNPTAEVDIHRTEPSGSRWDRIDTGLVLIAAVVTVIVHPVHAMLSHSYWLDEAWVAILQRVPWSRVPTVALTTPLGFSALLRLVPGSGLQRARLVVLMFSVLTVVMAYVLARSLAWSSQWRARVAAISTAVVVMLAPLSLGRNDLKQYTSDAFCALVV